MIVEGARTFPAPRQNVYDLLQDPDVLAKSLPGGKSLVKIADARFEGVMSVGVGPVTAVEFNVKVEVFDQVPPERFSLRIDGKGAVGFARGTASVSLTEAADGTVMSYRADLQVGGKIASVGQRLLDSASKSMTRQGLDSLTRELDARLGVRHLEPLMMTRRQRLIRYAIVGGGALFALVGVAYCFGVVR